METVKVNLKPLEVELLQKAKLRNAVLLRPVNHSGFGQAIDWDQVFLGQGFVPDRLSSYWPDERGRGGSVIVTYHCIGFGGPKSHRKHKVGMLHGASSSDPQSVQHRKYQRDSSINSLISRSG
jgi:hypothetical protein